MNLDQAFQYYQSKYHMRAWVDSIWNPITIANKLIYPLWREDQWSYVHGAMFANGLPVNAKISKLIGGNRVVTALIIEEYNGSVVAHDRAQWVYAMVSRDSGELFGVKGIRWLIGGKLAVYDAINEEWNTPWKKVWEILLPKE